MKKPPLSILFSLALFTALFSTALFPYFRLSAFSPFLAVAYHRTRFQKSLWLSLLCGLILDVTTSQTHFGLYALSYCLATVILYKQKRHFFEEKPLALSLFTALISAVSGLVILLLSFSFDSQFAFTPTLFLSELVCMPFLDAVYAFVWFTCPLRLYAYVQRVGWKNLFKKKQEES